MSTATNGAATEAAFDAIAEATKDAGTAAVEATALVGPAAEQASRTAREVAPAAWLTASKTITKLSLDAYDASMRAYLDYAESVFAASKASWAIDLAQTTPKIVSEFAANYTNAARGLFVK